MVITDRFMPGMNGDALAAEIKRLSPITPVILMSGYASPQRTFPANLFLQKPFTHAVLTAAIARSVAATPPAG